MTAVLDFALLPPEVNSGRMYSGAGSGPMLAAASAWRGLAAELRSTALAYHSVLTTLIGEAWHGPAAASMAGAAMPYGAWMSTTAAQAEQTATQAEAAAAAYDAAFAATVPPPVIAANRAALVALIATNILGQNTPAIAATEAAYAEMWAQDAAAMYGYAASSAVATALTPFVEPQQTANPAGAQAQSAAVAQATATPAGTQQSTLAQLMSALPTTLRNLASSGSGGWDPFAPGSAADTGGLNGLMNMFSGSNTAFGALANSTLGNSIFSSGFYMPSNTIAPFMSLLGSGAANSAGDAAEAAGQAAAGALGDAAAAPVGEMASAGSAVAGGLGQASMVGPMSVPPSWAMPAPLASTVSPTLDGTPMIAPPAMAAGMPGVPVGAPAGQAYGRAMPQYGFRPTFVARPPAAG